MQGLFELINKTKKVNKAAKPSSKNLEAIIAAIDTATKLYLRKTYCLGWAATFVLEARKRGIDAKFLIGIQTSPFYAHAWAEFENTVIHDDSQVAQVLSVIASLPVDNEPQSPAIDQQTWQQDGKKETGRNIQ